MSRNYTYSPGSSLVSFFGSSFRVYETLLHKAADDNDKSRKGATFLKTTIQSLQLPLWMMFTHGALLFAILLSRIQSQASAKTFQFAHYHYDPTDKVNTKFDTTIWSWGTDYALGVLLCYFLYLLLMDKSNLALRNRSAALMACYTTSVIAGAIAHQFYTVDMLNTISFRILWTICVGSVTATGGFMGEVGSELSRRLLHKHVKIPVIPQWMWIVYSVYMTAVAIMGGLSCTRPACDTFLAGTTQTFPTFYCELVVLLHWWYCSDGNGKTGNVKFRLVYLAGFAFNCHLLPGYPLLVQYTNLELGHVNALMHLNLAFAWSMQVMGLLHFCRTLESAEKQNVPKITSKEDDSIANDSKESFGNERTLCNNRKP